MILADTSVWVDHFRNGNPRLGQLLEVGEVLTHPMVIGELSCGNLPNRVLALNMLQNLPRVTPIPDDLVSRAIEENRLAGKGIGWIDAHLLTAALASGIPLWTLDRRLQALHSSLRSASRT